MIDRLIASASRLDPDGLRQVVDLAEYLSPFTGIAPKPAPTPAPAEPQPTLEPASIDNTAPAAPNTVASSSATVPQDPAAVEAAEAEPADAEPLAGAPADDGGLEATYAAVGYYAAIVADTVGLLEEALGVLRGAGDRDGEEDTDAPS